MPSSIWNGGVTDVLRTSAWSVRTSISPVASLVLVVSSPRARTTPWILMGHSGRIVSAILKASPSECSGSKVSCVMPSRSRRSQKIRPPWSRRRLTQPVRVTSSPTFSRRSSPQVRVCMECSSMGRVWLIPVILLYGSVPPRVVPGGVVQICPACVNRAARHGVLSYRTCVDVPRKSSSCPKT